MYHIYIFVIDVEMHGYTARTSALAEMRGKVLAYHILIATHTATHTATHSATHIATRTATCTATLWRCIDVVQGRVHSDGYAKEPSPAIFSLQHTLQHTATHCNTQCNTHCNTHCNTLEKCECVAKTCWTVINVHKSPRLIYSTAVIHVQI